MNFRLRLTVDNDAEYFYYKNSGQTVEPLWVQSAIGSNNNITLIVIIVTNILSMLIAHICNYRTVSAIFNETLLLFMSYRVFFTAQKIFEKRFTIAFFINLSDNTLNRFTKHKAVCFFMKSNTR